MAKNRSVLLWLIVPPLMTLLPNSALPQGRPNIIWANAGHSGYVNSVKYSPDGQLFVSGSNDRTIKLWHSNGMFIRTFVIPYDINGQLTDVLSVAFSPDGALIAAGVEQYNATTQTEFGAVQIWRVADGALVQNFSGYGAAVNSVAFSPDGQYVASGGQDRSVKVWQMASGTLVSTRFDHAQRVNEVAFSPNGQWLASGSDDRTAKLYRTSDWGLERTFTGHTDSITSLGFSANNANLATGGFDGTIRLSRVDDGALVFSLPHGSNVLSLTFTQDGHTLASGAWDKSIKLWDPDQGVLLDTLLGHTGAPLTLAFSPTSRLLASGSWYPEFAIRVWGQRHGGRPPRFTNHSGSINELIFTPNHQLISGGDVTARFWDEGNGRYLSAIMPAAPSVQPLALSPNGQLIALPAANHTVQIYRTSDHTLVQTLTGHTQDITGLAFSHDGHLLASGGFFDGTNDVIKLWNVSNWSLVRELSNQSTFGPFESINFSPEDSLVAATCEGSPAIWRVADGGFVRTFPGGGPTQFSPGGAVFAVGSSPVRVYRTLDWLQVATLSDQNQALTFTPDGQYLATAGRSQIQFWRVLDWTVEQFYDEELGYGGSGVTSLAFSPDGARFAYGREDAVLAVATNPVQSAGNEIGKGRDLTR